MKISLYLMTLKGLNVLQGIINANYSSLISGVIIGDDKNVVKDYSEEIRMLCEKNGISYCFRKDSCFFKSDYSIAISWRWIIHSNSKLIVLHDSILPKYRGFAPLVNMLLNQEKEIGVTALFATNDYDRGDIIKQEQIRINYPIKIQTAIEKISELYVKIVLDLFKYLVHEELLTSIKQDESRATYCLWRGEEDYHIQWDKDARYILNFINSVSYPYKGAYSFINNKQKVRILDAEIFPDVIIENRNVGKIIFIHDGFPIVVCGKGLLKLTYVVDDSTGESILPLKRFRIRFI